MGLDLSGMDVQQVGALAGQLETQAKAINSVIGAVDAVVAGLLDVWSGDNMDAFASAWRHGHRSAASVTASELLGYVGQLRAEMAQQVAASDGELGGSPGHKGGGFLGLGALESGLVGAVHGGLEKDVLGFVGRAEHAVEKVDMNIANWTVTQLDDHWQTIRTVLIWGTAAVSVALLVTGVGAPAAMLVGVVGSDLTLGGDAFVARGSDTNPGERSAAASDEEPDAFGGVLSTLGGLGTVAKVPMLKALAPDVFDTAKGVSGAITDEAGQTVAHVEATLGEKAPTLTRLVNESSSALAGQWIQSQVTNAATPIVNAVPPNFVNELVDPPELGGRRIILPVPAQGLFE